MVDSLDQFALQLEQALEYTGGTHTLEDLQAAVDAGEIQVWPGVESIMLTKIVDQPLKRELVFFLAAGNLAEIKRLYHVVMDYGRKQGCDRAVFIGRAGWSRTFLTRECGWVETHRVYVKELAGSSTQPPSEGSRLIPLKESDNGKGRNSTGRGRARGSLESLRA